MNTNYRKKALRKRTYIYVLVAIWITLSYSILFLLTEESISELTLEDGFFELMSSIWFFFAGILFLFLFFRSKHGNDFYFLKFKKNIFFLLLGLLFIFAAGEEISWGQRILNIETPEAMLELNEQNEINIHNLSIFNGSVDGEKKTGLALLFTIHKLFEMFWFSFCFLVPLLHRFSPKTRTFLNRINLPIVPLWLGSLFIFTFLLSRLVALFIPGIYLHNLIEIKESTFSLLFLLTGSWFIFRQKVRNLKIKSTTD